MMGQENSEQNSAVQNDDLQRGADVPTLAHLTTMQVGGPCERLLVANTAEELARYARELARGWDDWLLLGGGSNTIVCDEGYPGTVLLVRNTGISEIADPSLPAGTVRVRAQAGQNWDESVAWAAEKGYAGIEMLAGIPGLCGAAPVQNIGAYGGELSQTLHSVTCYDIELDEVREMQAAELELGYRTSILKQGYRAVILSIDLLLQNNSAQPEPLSAPLAFPQLARALGAELGTKLPLKKVREAVLQVRAAKGMVLNEIDPDTRSAGSFFTNPIVSEHFARTLPADAPRFPIGSEDDTPQIVPLETYLQNLADTELQGGNGFYQAPAFDSIDAFNHETQPVAYPQTQNSSAATPAGPQVKLSAAWLIENAGVPRGFTIPGSGAAVSSKHTLAITNRGHATAADIAELARYIVSMVQTEFGVLLTPEPNIYGLEI
ncbi:MAG: UDP-N-acetylmuramate dehydrogenase [Microbacteriaceae bacterium]|nr:UDP-N-acetylmuramate dehydrogenase [Microbacteriaceae bacterium]